MGKLFLSAVIFLSIRENWICFRLQKYLVGGFWLRAVNPPSSARIWFLWVWLRASTQITQALQHQHSFIFFWICRKRFCRCSHRAHGRGEEPCSGSGVGRMSPKCWEGLTESFLQSLETHSVQWPLDRSKNTETITLHVRETKYLSSAMGTVHCSELCSSLKGCLILTDKRQWYK